MDLKYLAQEKVWLDKSRYADAERLYYERLSKKQAKKDIEVVAIDCEMVGKHPDGKELDKMDLKNLAQEKVWLDKSRYADAERLYYERLSKKQAKKDIEVVAIDCEMVGKHPDGKELDKMDLKNLAQEKVWLDKSRYADAERLYYERLSKKQAKKDIEVVAIDCEMVGKYPDGKESMLARVSIVNFEGETIYDKFVKPTAKVTDYRTPTSGIRPKDIENGEVFDKVKIEVQQLLKKKLLVGHSLTHDLRSLTISHPKHMIRDTSMYWPFRRLAKGKTPSLKGLILHFFGARIQEGEHSSVQDARAALQLYMLARKDWEITVQKQKTRP